MFLRFEILLFLLFFYITIQAQESDISFPQTKEIIVTGKTKHVDITLHAKYILDTMTNTNNTKMVLAKEVHFKDTLEVFSSDFFNDLKESIEGNNTGPLRNYTSDVQPLKLQTADFNFDGYLDIYFINKYGHSKVSAYNFYLFDQNSYKYVRSKDLSEMYWSRFELDSENKSIRFIRDIGRGKLLVTDHQINIDGSLVTTHEEMISSKE